MVMLLNRFFIKIVIVMQSQRCGGVQKEQRNIVNPANRPIKSEQIKEGYRQQKNELLKKN